MTHSNADHNLLFGVLALQNDFVSREELITVVSVWLQDKSKPLSLILRERNALPEDEHQLLSALAKMHLERHDNKPENSLANISSISTSVRDELRRLGDADVEASLAHLATANRHEFADDPYATQTLALTESNFGNDRFRILRPHAKGGLGQVSVALDQELNREVALKEIQSQYVDNADCRKRFVQEAEITGGLEHPGIVPVYGLGQYGDGRPFYAMRFIRGDSLAEAIKRFHKADHPIHDQGLRNLELRKLLRRFVDVCNAVEYAHSRGVLHRDLKPGNVMMGKYGETLLVDWGLAKPVGKSEAYDQSDESTLRLSSDSGSAPTQLGSAVGTPSYMSPEQAAGSLNQLGPTSDVYSLGATLYCLLTGRPPVVEKELGSILMKVQVGDFPPPRQIKAEVPKPLEAICLRAMSFRQSDRYASPNELAEEIERWLADEAVSARRESLLERSGRWFRRHRAWALAAATALLAITVICLGAFLVVDRARQSEQEQRRQSTDRLAQIRRVIDHLVSDVAVSLQQIPGGQRVERALLQRAAEEYQLLSSEKSDNRELQTESALTTLRLGVFERLLNDFHGAQEHIGRSRSDFLRLAEEAPENRELQQHLAESDVEIGVLHSDRGELKVAQQAFQRAMSRWLALQHTKQDDVTYRAGLARCHHKLGDVIANQGDLEKSLPHLESAIEQYAWLVERHSDRILFRRNLASSYNSIGAVYERQGQWQKAEESYRAGITDAMNVAKTASNSGITGLLVLLEENLADLLVELGRLSEAAKLFEQSIVKFEPVAQANPDIPKYLWRLTIYRSRYSRLKREQGQNENAALVLSKNVVDVELLIERFPDNPDHYESAATAYIEVAMVQLNLGRLGESADAAAKAVAYSRTLLDLFPISEGHRTLLANSLSHQGRALRRLGRFSETEVVWKQSVDQFRLLVDENPQEVDARDKCALALANYGGVLLQLGKLEAGLTALDDAVSRYEQLLEDAPLNPGFQERWLMSLQQRGSAYLLLGQSENGILSLRAAVKKGEGLVSAYRDNPRHLYRLSEAYGTLGSLEYSAGHADESDKSLGRAYELADELCRDFPDQFDYRRSRHLIGMNRAMGLTELGRYAEANTAWKVIVDQDKFQMPDQALASYALALAADDQYEDALKVADTLSPDSEGSIGGQMSAAIAYAVSYTSASKDVSLTDEQRRKVLDHCSERALMFARSSLQGGWLETRSDVEAFKKAFAALLDGPEFRVLVDEMEEKFPPPQKPNAEPPKTNIVPDR